MSLLNELTQKYAAVDLDTIFDKVGIKANIILSENRQHLK